MPDQKTYKMNLHNDLLSYVNLIMIADWVSRYSDPAKSLQNLAAGWTNRVEYLQKEAFKDIKTDDDYDVIQIITELHIDFDRKKVIKEVTKEFSDTIFDLLRQMGKPVGR